jgi:hypothetical protein
MADIADLQRHKKFFEDLLMYLPPKELTEAEPESEKSPDSPPPLPPPPPAPRHPPRGLIELKRTKIRPGFEGTNVIRRKRRP